MDRGIALFPLSFFCKYKYFVANLSMFAKKNVISQVEIKQAIKIY